MVLKFDVTNNTYVDFIAELRDQARDKDKYSHGRPILPLETDADPAYIDLNLTISGVDKGLLKIRRYDLRLVDYQNPLGNVIVVDEFNLYDDESKLVESGLEGLMLGLPLFIEAVNSLADSSKVNVDVETPFVVGCDTEKSTSTGSQVNSDVRTYLAVVCLVLCEGAKLDLLSCLLNNAFKSGSEVRLSSWLLQRINDWGLFSEELLLEELHWETADCNLYLADPNIDWNDGRRMIGVTCQDLARCLGILRADPPPPPLAPMEDYKFLSGTTLVEIYSVSVFFNGGRSGSVFGYITVDNKGEVFYIYARGPNYCEFIESHGTLSLQEPPSAIVVDRERGPLRIHLDLREVGQVGGNFQVKGRVAWESSVRDNFYDSRLSALIRGNNGYAVVYYTVFEDAIVAVVEATLLPKEGQPDTKDVCVCGKISARYRDILCVADFHYKYYQTTLFDKPPSIESAPLLCANSGTCRKGGQRVKLGESIKLSRTRVVVHVEDALIISADLKSCEGTPIVTGSMEWLPKELGDFESIMEGHPDDSHILQVKVKWRIISKSEMEEN